MEALYKLKINDLDSQFIDYLKTKFKDLMVEIKVVNTSTDETDALMKHPATRTKLLKSVKNVKKGNVMLISDDEIENEEVFFTAIKERYAKISV